MSRMLATFGAAPATVTEAVGAHALRQFASLARVHADGWGTAWTDGTDAAPRARRDIARLDPDAAWDLTAPERARGRLLYLRFASRGAPVRIENVQPFVRRGIAFQHNGALAPRERAVSLLAAPSRELLQGSTDSEAYFLLALEHADRLGRAIGPRDTASPSIDSDAFADGLVAAVRALREAFPAACLNAFALTADALIVVHAPGTVAAPHDAFERRGIGLGALPPGHDETYNVLSASADADRVVVATSGVVSADLRPLPSRSVTVFSTAGGRLARATRDLTA